MRLTKWSHDNPRHPFNHLGGQSTRKDCDWSLLTYEDAVRFAKSVSNYTIFKHSHSRMFIAIADRGWLPDLLQYLSHSNRSFHDAVDIHNRAQSRLQRRQEKKA